MTGLEGALDVLRRRGWTQGRLRAGDGARCSIGAIIAVTNVVDVERGLVDQLAGVIREQWPEFCLAADVTSREYLRGEQVFASQLMLDRQLVIGFNDADLRTFAEVEAIFEKAIVREQETVT